MGVCCSKSVDSASDTSDTDSEVASRKVSRRRPSEQHGTGILKAEVGSSIRVQHMLTTSDSHIQLRPSALPTAVKGCLNSPRAGAA